VIFIIVCISWNNKSFLIKDTIKKDKKILYVSTVSSCEYIRPCNQPQKYYIQKVWRGRRRFYHRFELPCIYHPFFKKNKDGLMWRPRPSVCDLASPVTHLLIFSVLLEIFKQLINPHITQFQWVSRKSATWRLYIPYGSKWNYI